MKDRSGIVGSSVPVECLSLVGSFLGSIEDLLSLCLALERFEYALEDVTTLHGDGRLDLEERKFVENRLRSRLRTLERLSLVRSNLETETVHKLVTENCGSLRWLELVKCLHGANSSWFRFLFHGLEKFPTLEVLLFCGYHDSDRIDDIGDLIFPVTSSLTMVQLSNCNLSVNASLMLVHQLNSLEYLFLGGNMSQDDENGLANINEKVTNDSVKMIEVTFWSPMKRGLLKTMITNSEERIKFIDFLEYNTIKDLEIQLPSSTLVCSDRTNRTPLHILADQQGSAEMEDHCHKLISLGADIDRPSFYKGQSPLFHACKSGNMGFLRAILRLGPRGEMMLLNGLQRKNLSGETPLFLSSLRGHGEMVQAICTVVAKFKYHDLRAFVDMNITRPDGWNPLHAAAMNGNQACVKALLNLFPIQSKTRFQQTCAHIAAFAGHQQVLAILVRKQKKILFMKDSERLSPYQIANRRGHRDCAQFLQNELSRVVKNKKQAY